uniref:EMI domain-containing protein n=1 Tax=Denticeps clupeoides TaxID=299321 RepID=A0AAY4EEG2_9TELE
MFAILVAVLSCHCQKNFSVYFCKGFIVCCNECASFYECDRNYCSYVVEKMVSFTMQDGVAPHVKAEYNRCPWHMKCPPLKYHLYYKPTYKVAHKTMTELEWRCCPGYSGMKCDTGPYAQLLPMQKGPLQKSPMPMQKGPVTERLDRMEEDVQRLSRGLETLRGTVTSMEDGLRASLREDANRMISALLSASPGAAAHVATHDSAVGFGVLPGGPPHTEVLDGVQFSSLSELAGKVAELHNELQAKSAELVELRDTVLGHDGTLRQLTNQSKGIPKGPDRQKAVKMLLETKMNGTQAALLGNFVRRLESAERRCAERIGEVHSNCQKEQMDGQGHLQEALEQSTTDLRKDLLDLQAQLHAFGLDESCCNRMPHLLERVVLLEKSVSGLNESQIHLQAELGGHRDHVEGMIEGRLAYVEDKLNISSTEKGKQSVSALQDFMGVEARFEDKLKALEDRLFRAVGEIGNGSTPMLVQKQIRSLEVLCTSSCSSARMLRRDDDQLQASEGKEREEKQTEKLDYLNATLELLLRRLAEREDEEGGVLGAVTLLKLKVNTVNQTLWGLQNTLGAIEQEVGWANTTWQQREQRLAQQVKGVVQLVARQASMLGAGDRRLSRVKGELQELRKRLAGELHGCRTAALGVQKEVTEVGGRVARVEGQCEGMAQLAEDLERIRGELDRHSSEYLSQVNGTLVSHSLQLTELRDSLKNCTMEAAPGHTSRSL